MRPKESSIRWGANPSIGILEGALFVGGGVILWHAQIFSTVDILNLSCDVTSGYSNSF